MHDAGAISACVAPLFSQRPDIHLWLHHYTQLGVNKFYMYVPRLHYHEPHTYEAPHEVCLWGFSLPAMAPIQLHEGACMGPPENFLLPKQLRPEGLLGT